MMHSRKTTEITGYADTVNGSTYCLDCIDEWEAANLTTIFLGDEWDAPGPVCDNCFESIETNLIYYMGDKNENGK